MVREVNLCGVIEGFYGPPWTHEERLDLIRFCGQEQLTTWVHAPKDDPYHRRLWRDPYPDAELGRLAELAHEADRVGVAFAYALAPGLDISYSEPAELDALLAKVEQLRSIGVRHFQLLWDDIDDTRPRGEDHAAVSNRFASEVRQPGPLVVCPTAYAGTGDGEYRRALGAALDPEIVLYWTGPEVVSHGITREELELSVFRYAGHEHLLWDNYPVNDWDPSTLFLGPLRGRDPRLADGGLRGIVANAMVQAVPSKLALATVADWARDPHAYEPTASFERALQLYGAEVVEALRRLSRDRPQGAAADTADTQALVGALAFGVDAATGAALLEPFV